jgi:hypothetical protein
LIINNLKIIKMENAKQELLEAIEGKSKLKCANIQLGDYRVRKVIKLKVGYSEAEYNDFLKELDFEYDSGFGGQELFGTLWHEDGTWQERGEYDGSEWWNHNQLPEIPSELL